MNKKKIINDPVYGFITIQNELIYDLINHPWFQRLRRIKQLGLTDFVYPGALHTRFHHALGAMHLMQETLDNLRQKGIDISDEEYSASLLAILLHDIGHSPFSHALENVLITKINHEEMSALIMDELNLQYDGALDLAITIFKNQYHRKFFNQLVSSQLDIDRLDYLNRDSFFTGVSEGKIGSERIIKLLNVYEDELVIEEKGIYSIENFLSSRRLMYWQVYLHKTTVAVEQMLVQIIMRAKEIQAVEQIGEELKYFIQSNVNISDIKRSPEILSHYTFLDDFDIMSAVKNWTKSEDFVIRNYCQLLLDRHLLKVKFFEKSVSNSELEKVKKKISDQNIPDEYLDYFVITGEKTNAAYVAGDHQINVLTKNKKKVDIAQASDLPNIKAMRKIVKKHYLCWPKSLFL